MDCTEEFARELVRDHASRGDPAPRDSPPPRLVKAHALATSTVEHLRALAIDESCRLADLPADARRAFLRDVAAGRVALPEGAREPWWEQSPEAVRSTTKGFERLVRVVHAAPEEVEDRSARSPWDHRVVMDAEERGALPPATSLTRKQLSSHAFVASLGEMLFGVAFAWRFLAADPEGLVAEAVELVGTCAPCLTSASAAPIDEYGPSSLTDVCLASLEECSRRCTAEPTICAPPGLLRQVLLDVKHICSSRHMVLESLARLTEWLGMAMDLENRTLDGDTDPALFNLPGLHPTRPNPPSHRSLARLFAARMKVWIHFLWVMDAPDWAMSSVRDACTHILRITASTVTTTTTSTTERLVQGLDDPKTSRLAKVREQYLSQPDSCIAEVEDLSNCREDNLDEMD
jgi:hypothetical protein